MHNQNMSDIIEAYLKKVLGQDERVEIRRSEMANRFNCVPSQINYVINTRFTVQQGYLVESKRGGGGYIRIIKVKLIDEVEMLDMMIDIIGNKITQKNACSIIERLFETEMLTKREANIILSVMEKSLLNADGIIENELRARLLVAFLNNLKYE